MKRLFILFAISVSLFSQVPFPGGSSGGGGGSSSNFTSAPPYFSDGTNFFSSTGYRVTKPSGSPTFLSSTATTSAGANGNIQLSACSDDCFVSLNGTSSVESEFQCLAIQADASGSFSHCAIWLWDVTNSLIYAFYPSYVANVANGGHVVWFFQQWTYNGTGNPVFSTSLNSLELSYAGYSYLAHAKLSVSGGTISAQISLDGGATFYTAATHAIGTVSKGGYELSSSAIMNVYSVTVN